MKDLDLKKNIINLTHTDMDGSGCSILSKLVFPDRDVIHTSYGRIADILEGLRYTKENQLLITDLCFTEEDFELLEDISDNFDKIVYIDHHLYEFDYKKFRSDKIKIYVDTKACATKLTYAYLKQYKDLSEYRELTEIINSFDIWQEDSEYFSRGKNYNKLFWNIGQKQFEYQFFKNPSLDEARENKIKEINKEIKEYFKNNKDRIIFDEDIVVSFLDEYISEIKDVFKKQKVSINFMKNCHFSIRINSEVSEEKAELIREAFLKKVFKPAQVISAGGHLRAFGITIVEAEIFEIKSKVELMSKIAKKVLDRDK